ncbi:MAG: hypothetical protein R2771_15780 [Saprospiraceae bacterium]
MSCTGGTLVMDDCDGDGSMTIPCIEAGVTYYILVATTDDAGNFRLRYYCI